jgi:hypothetical protein
MALLFQGYEAGIGGAYTPDAGSVLSWANDQAHSGSRSLKYAGSAVVDGAIWSHPDSVNPAADGYFPVTPGTFLGFDGWFRSNSSTSTNAVNVWLQLVDANGAAITTVVVGSITSMAANTWTRCIGTGNYVPAGAAYGRLAFTLYGGGGAGDVTWIDDILIDTIAVALPSADITVTNWYRLTSGNVTNLYTAIDDLIEDASDYVEGAYRSNGAIYTCALAPIVDPLSSERHVVSFYALRVTNTGATTCKCDLMQGATVIATFTTPAMTNAKIQYSFLLTAAQADAITDYGNLSLRFTQNVPSGGTSASVRITSARFAAPLPPPPPSTAQVKVRSGGAFATKPTKYRSGGAFTTKPRKVRVGGAFVDA